MNLSHVVEYNHMVLLLQYALSFQTLYLVIVLHFNNIILYVIIVHNLCFQFILFGCNKLK